MIIDNNKEEEFFQCPVGTFNGHLVEMCEGAHQLIIDKYTCELTPTEYRIAMQLLRNYRRSVPIEELVEGTFDPEYRKALSKHVTNVRKMLRPLLNVRIEYDSIGLNGGYVMLPLAEGPLLESHNENRIKDFDTK